MTILTASDPPPFTLIRGERESPYVVACDHAGNRIPEYFGEFGLSPQEREAHIAWDIGAAQVARMLAAHLSGGVVLQTYSRLLIDCNRPPRVASSIPEKSENTFIEANRNLSRADREARRMAIFDPYHDAIRSLLDDRERRRQRTVLVSVHSFTPEFHGIARPMHLGLLFNRDARLGRLLKNRLSRDTALVVAENEPYAVSDETDYTIPVHGEQRGIAHVMLEIRNDLIADEAGQSAWAERLGALLLGVDGELGRR